MTTIYNYIPKMNERIHAAAQLMSMSNIKVVRELLEISYFTLEIVESGFELVCANYMLPNVNGFAQMAELFLEIFEVEDNQHTFAIIMKNLLRSYDSQYFSVLEKLIDCGVETDLIHFCFRNVPLDMFMIYVEKHDLVIGDNDIIQMLSSSLCRPNNEMCECMFQMWEAQTTTRDLQKLYQIAFHAFIHPNQSYFLRLIQNMDSTERDIILFTIIRIHPNYPNILVYTSNVPLRNELIMLCEIKRLTSPKSLNSAQHFPNCGIFGSDHLSNIIDEDSHAHDLYNTVAEYLSGPHEIDIPESIMSILITLCSMLNF